MELSPTRAWGAYVIWGTLVRRWGGERVDVAGDAVDMCGIVMDSAATSSPARFVSLRLPQGFWWGFGALLVVMAGSVLPLCGGMFRCGCSLLHGDRHCNVHVAGVSHCPWCAAHWSVMAGVFAAVLVVGAAGVYGGLKISRADGGWRRFLAGVGLGVAGYLVTSSLAGLIMAVAMRYPVWWGIRVYG